MVASAQQLRVEGVYEQKDAGFFMMRVKIPGGVLSSEQAFKICEVAERFGRQTVHLTTRNSIEFHWLPADGLAEANRMLASVGLTTRGACGGAVRGITCSTATLGAYPQVQALARKIHQHFTQNPHFEGLPKKFKVCVEAGYEGARHLIQDTGIVFAGLVEGEPRYDVWVAGGLGKEPVPAFLLEDGVSEGRVFALLEAVVAVYKAGASPGKRLKHLVAGIGRVEFVGLLAPRLEAVPSLEIRDGFAKSLTPEAGEDTSFVEARVFAGELATTGLRRLASIGLEYTRGWLLVTPDQNLAFRLKGDRAAALEQELADAGFRDGSREERVKFRVCPGNHECRMGLGPTRDITRQVIARMCGAGEGLGWAISGCPNSCAQPQLADVGIIIAKLPKDEKGERSPLFDLYRRTGETLGAVMHSDLTLDQLLEAVAVIS